MKARYDIIFIIFCISIVIGVLGGLSFTTSDKIKETSKFRKAYRDFVASYVPEKIKPGNIEEAENIETPPEVDIEMLKNIMHFDMASYTRLPEELKTDIIQEVVLNSQKYNIDARLVYAVLFTESTFRNNVKHTPTYVKQLKKKVQAIGMGGVVWDFWKDYLVENTSLTKKSDLKDWRKNIEATSAILAYLYNYKMHPKAKDSKESVAIRYYGLYNIEYIEKINHAYERL